MADFLSASERARIIEAAQRYGPWNMENIREARRARGISQEELAAGLGCRSETIRDWEAGIYPPKHAYQKLLSLFFGLAPRST